MAEGRKDAVNQSLESLSVSYRRIPAEQNLPTTPAGAPGRFAVWRRTAKGRGRVAGSEVRDKDQAQMQP